MAYGPLLAAIRDPDPVIFLEPTKIYRPVANKYQMARMSPLDALFSAKALM
jgi:pyruvate dehydrogenase E1 component beta subunit